MGDDEHAQPHPGGDFPEMTHDVIRVAVVQLPGRLVGKKNPRSIDQGAGDGHPLLLPAGEPVAALVFLLGQVDPRQGLAHPGFAFPARDPGVDERVFDVFGRRGVGENIAALQDEPEELPAKTRFLAVPEGKHVLPQNAVLSRLARQKQAQNLQQRGLAAARRPHDGRDLPGAKGQEYAAQNRFATVTFAQILDLKQHFHGVPV